MFISGTTHREMVDGFDWNLPDRFNIAVACCDAIASTDPQKTALMEWVPGKPSNHTSYGQLQSLSNQLAHGLSALGMQAGDRLAIILPQSVEAVLCHLATYKLAGITVPLARLFAPDALEFRLQNAGVSIAVTNRDGLEKLRQIRATLPMLRHIICIDECDPADAQSFQNLCENQPEDYKPVETLPDTPALIIYTSGTTGPPKGALHGHRVLLGHIPGVQVHHEFLPLPGDRTWTPADWAWAGGLLNILLPSLFLGVPVVFGGLERFEPERAFQLLSEMAVRNAFIPPTALNLMKTVPEPAKRYPLNLRTIGSGGESLAASTYQWARDELNLVINEFYGQTECNLVLSSCSKLGISKPGAIGKPVPGHKVAIINAEGQPVETGQRGQVAVARPDPVMFLEYWQDPAATEAKFIGDWMTTGDQAVEDEEGYYCFVGRDDDIINSAGYRVGPGEIEDCLLSHPSVELAVAVGKPDPLRSQIVKAFVVLKDEVSPSAQLGDEIRLHVKSKMAANIYPREIEFVKSIPLTTTGKVIRRHFRELAERESQAENPDDAPV